MGTRQLRLSDREQIRQRINEFLGKQINIVLADSTVQFGELTAVKGAEITLRNMRQKKFVYALAAIAELYVDTNA